jgi:DNA-directed RNA polymerase specialized sigma24 family protein
MTTVSDHLLDETQNGCSATEDRLAVLIARALNEDRQAWVALHKRFQPLIIGTCFRYRVFGGDTDDVSQTVWMQLVRNLDQVRPRAGAEENLLR